MTEVIAHTIAGAVTVSGIGRTALYGLIGAGKIEARKVGRHTLIIDKSLRDYIAGLPQAEITTGQPPATKASTLFKDAEPEISDAPRIRGRSRSAT